MIDWTKPIRFKNGRPARLVETLADGSHEIERTDETDITRYWRVPPDGQFADGTLGKRGGFDLENVADNLAFPVALGGRERTVTNPPLNQGQNKSFGVWLWLPSTILQNSQGFRPGQAASFMQSVQGLTMVAIGLPFMQRDHFPRDTVLMISWFVADAEKFHPAHPVLRSAASQWLCYFV